MKILRPIRRLLAVLLLTAGPAAPRLRRRARLPRHDQGRRGAAAGRAQADLALLRSGRAQLRHHEGRPEAARRAGPARVPAGLLPRPQPAHDRRRHARPQVGQHQRLHRGRAGQAGLRLAHRRPDLRHLPGARPQALRADRLHAAGALRQAGALPARMAARPALQQDLHGLGLSAEGLREVGRARLPVGEAQRREVRAGRGGALVLGGLERAQHRVLAGHARGVPQAPRLRGRRGAPRPAHGPGGRAGHRGRRGRHVPGATSSSTACAAPTTPRARRARRSTSSPSTPRGRRRSWTATCGWGSPTSCGRSTGLRRHRVVPGAEDASRSSSASPTPKAAPPARDRSSATATARCTRATPRPASPASTTWPPSTASTSRARSPGPSSSRTSPTSPASGPWPATASTCPC